MAALQFFRSLPKAKTIDATTIKGNIPLEHKQLNANIFEWFINGGVSPPGMQTGLAVNEGGGGALFSTAIGRNVQILEMDVWTEGEAARGNGSGRGIFEIKVGPGE